jgi:hypothetical protein
VTDLFSVYEWLPDGSFLCVGSRLDAEAAVLRAQVSTRKPATLLGVIKKVTIVADSDYATVFLWEDGRVVYPPGDRGSNGK